MHPTTLRPFARTLAILVPLLLVAQLRADESIVLIEAESKTTNRASFSSVDDAYASGKAYAATSSDYKPLIISDHPAIEADSLSFWVRVRGAAFQLKTINADGRAHSSSSLKNTLI